MNSFGAPTVNARRGFMLIAVLVIVGSALLVATGLVFFAQTEAAMSSSSAEAAQSRALVWSGLQAVMSRIHDQRERILAGELPQIEPQLIIYETATRAGVVRLLPGYDGALLACESGKLDLNSVDAAALSATGLVDETLAHRIIGSRDNRTSRSFASTHDLLAVADAGITAEQFYGPIDGLDLMNAAQRPDEDVGSRIARRLEAPLARGWCDVFTVFSVEPEVQRDGRPRINLNQPWSDVLGREVEEQFGREAAEGLNGLMADGATFETDARVFQVMRQLNVPPQDWPPIVDAFATSAEPLRYGRLDINTASYEALLGVPGMTSEQASQIVRMREQLSADQRSTIAWLAVEGIVAPEAYDQLAGRITTRCWTYRVRLAAGEVIGEQLEGPLLHPIIVEAVIDLAGVRPRVAYWRDVTLLQAVTQLSANVVSVEPETDERSPQSGTAEPVESGSVVVDDFEAGSAEPQRGAGAVGGRGATAPGSATQPQTPPAPTGRRVGRWLSPS